MNEPELEIFYEGMEAFKRGEYESAAELFGRSLRLRAHAKTYFMLYECCMKLGIADKAFECIEKSYRENCRGDKISYEYAKMLLWYKKDSDGALKILGDIIKRNPDYKKAQALDYIIRLQRQGICRDLSAVFLEDFKAVSEKGERYIYIAFGADGNGREAVLDVRITNEPAGAAYDGILESMKNRDAMGISIVCHGCPCVISEAAKRYFPGAVCLIPPGKIMRNVCGTVRCKDRKSIREDIEKILLSPTPEEADKCLENFAERWVGTYPNIINVSGLDGGEIAALFCFSRKMRMKLLSFSAAGKCRDIMERYFKSYRICSDDDITGIVYKGILGAVGSADLLSEN